jgi:hypothetical protein
MLQSGPQRDLIAAALALRSGKAADAARITDAVIATLQEIEAALAPIVGQRGVAALYKRSIFLASAAHPWLADSHDGGMQAAIDLAPLKAALAQQTSSDAAAGGTALFLTFHGLLGSLVGPGLTERLLHSVWAHSSSGEPPQDTPP